PALRRVTPAGTLTAGTGLGAAVLVRGLLTFAFFGTEAFLPLMLREARGISPTLAGIVLTTGAVSWTTGSWVHARLAPRTTGRAAISVLVLRLAPVAPESPPRSASRSPAASPGSRCRAGSMRRGLR